MKAVSRFAEKECRLPIYDLHLGIRTAKKNYLAFMVNRSIILFGLGIYGPITQKELQVEYGLLMDDFCNPGNQKLLLMRCTINVKFSGGRQIVPLYFNDPVKLRRFQQYIVYLDVCSYQTYRGVKGMETVREDKIKFIFTHDFDKSSLSTPFGGNIPELYYQIPEIDVLCEHGKKKNNKIVKIRGNYTKLWKNKMKSDE